MLKVKRLTLRECMDVPDSSVRKFRNMLWFPFAMVCVSVLAQIAAPADQHRAYFIGYLAGGIVLFMLAILFPSLRRSDEVSAAKLLVQRQQWQRASVAAAGRLEAKRDPGEFIHYRNETLVQMLVELANRVDGVDAALLDEVAYRMTGGDRTSWLRQRAESGSAHRNLR